MSHLQGMGSFKSAKAGTAGKKGGWGKVKGAMKATSKSAAVDDEDKLNRSDEEVAALDPILPGKMYWVSDPHTVWTQVQIVSHEKHVVVVKDALGKERTLDLHFEECHSCNPRVVDDMTGLHDMHEPGIMFNLEERAKWDTTKELGEDGQQPYTYVQSVLVAVNPLRRVPHPPKEIYPGKKMMDCQPHPYGIAENCFQRLTSTSVSEGNMNQSIVISGESGAGKTESTKIALNYLTTRNPDPNSKSDWEELFDEAQNAKYYHNNKTGETKWEPPKATGTQDLDKRILASNPILESYGNAKTTRNSNSSRFGKFMILQFSTDKKYTFQGATMETYLLEKSRITYQMQNERNYHVFYLVIKGATEVHTDMKEKLSIADVTQYAYTNGSGCYEIAGFDDKEEYKDFHNAMYFVGMNDADIFSTFQVISCVLALGNVNFHDNEKDEAVPDDQTWVAIAAHQLGVEVGTLQKCLTEEMREVKGEVFFSKRNAKIATFCRNAVTKTVYQFLFDWIVDTVAQSLNGQPSNFPFIGILDIFGFETFKKNDFEQLLINFANETLQNTFNLSVLVAEMELYKKEEIKVEPIKFDDNMACVELIAGRPKGVLAQLEAVAQAPNPTDSKFCQAIHKLHEGNRFFPRPHPKDIRENFIVRHFADRVQYTVGSFITKNDNVVPKDLADMIEGCPHACIKQALDATRASKVKTVTGLFSKQMKSLTDKLHSTQCSFVRCIKPNPLMQAGLFDRHYSIEQLRFLGVLNTCKVLKMGLPSRVGYEHVGEPLRESLPPDLKAQFVRYGPRKVTNALLWAAEIPWDDYRLGKTMCFFRAGKIGQLDKVMKMCMSGLGSAEGQAFVARLKRWLLREKWKWACKLQINILSGVWLLELIRKKPPMALRLQTFFRMYIKRKTYRKQKQAVFQWHVAFLHTLTCQRFMAHYKYVHDNKEVMLAKQKEVKRKRLQQRLRGDTGKKKKKKQQEKKEGDAEGAEGEEQEPTGPSPVALKLQARIRAKLAKTKQRLRAGGGRADDAEEESSASTEDDSSVANILEQLNNALRAN